MVTSKPSSTNCPYALIFLLFFHYNSQYVILLISDQQSAVSYQPIHKLVDSISNILKVHILMVVLPGVFTSSHTEQRS